MLRTKRSPWLTSETLKMEELLLRKWEPLLSGREFGSTRRQRRGVRFGVSHFVPGNICGDQDPIRVSCRRTFLRTNENSLYILRTRQRRIYIWRLSPVFLVVTWMHGNSGHFWIRMVGTFGRLDVSRCSTLDAPAVEKKYAHRSTQKSSLIWPGLKGDVLSGKVQDGESPWEKCVSGSCKHELLDNITVYGVIVGVAYIVQE